MSEKKKKEDREEYKRMRIQKHTCEHTTVLSSRWLYILVLCISFREY